jgi:IMP dehydrogenase
MDITVGYKTLQYAFGFDDVSIVPSRETRDPDECDVSMELGGHKFALPVIASAMDGVVDVKFAHAMGKLGGLAVLNLHGLQTRYEDPQSVIAKILESAPEATTKVIQGLYREPIKEELVAKRVQEIKAGGVITAVSSIPQDAEHFGALARDAGADLFVIQSTVTSACHVSSKHKVLDLAKFCASFELPVIVGNCVSYDVAMDLMRAGAAGILVGIGPGAACTTRGVVGIGVPQITATLEVAQARNDFEKESGRRVAVITDGGMRKGGEICKAFASGADAVMLGSPFAGTEEAPAKGHHWGMATSHPSLPRGTLVRVGVRGSLENVLLGPAKVDDGSQNLVGSLQSAMGLCGAADIKAFHNARLVISSSFMSEGKMLQATQRVGMAR